MFTSTSTLIERAVRLGAARPTARTLVDPGRWAAWRTAADQLVVAGSIIDLTPAELDELIIEADRHSGRVTPERVASVVTEAAGVALVLCLALPFVLL
jgi:hypothetical protein